MGFIPFFFFFFVPSASLGLTNKTDGKTKKNKNKRIRISFIFIPSRIFSFSFWIYVYIIFDIACQTICFYIFYFRHFILYFHPFFHFSQFLFSLRVCLLCLLYVALNNGLEFKMQKILFYKYHVRFNSNGHWTWSRMPKGSNFTR